MADEGTNLDLHSQTEFSAEQKQKEFAWDLQRMQIDQIADRLGQPIDEGIKDTIVALNLLNINTVQSCAGHFAEEQKHSGLRTPYIDVEGKKNDVLKAEVNALYDKIEINEQDPSIEEEEMNRLYEQYHSLCAQERIPNLQEQQKLMGLLEAFYKDRLEVSYASRLVIQAGPTGARLECQGSAVIVLSDPITQAESLKSFQKEMQDFTAFLKVLFFKGKSTK